MQPEVGFCLYLRVHFGSKDYGVQGDAEGGLPPTFGLIFFGFFKSILTDQ